MLARLRGIYSAPMRAILLVLATVLLTTGCEHRPPVTRAAAGGAAASLQMREGLTWGEAVEILEPLAASDDGRWWWQLRYADGGAGADGKPRLILVDRDTGWARLPPADWRPRVPVSPYEPPPDRAVIQPGAFILVVADPRPGSERAQVGVDAAELNKLAGRTGLMPAFSVRVARDGSCTLIYGWQGDRGIVRDERVRDWLQIRTRYRSSRWVELGVE